MSETSRVKEMVAAMLLLPPDTISSGTPLQGLDDSLGKIKLTLGLRRLGLELPTGCAPKIFGDLEQAFSGNGAAPVATKPPATQEIAEPVVPAAPSGVQVGIEMQSIDDLPVAADYWEHEFYQGIFAKTEIAYAVVEGQPRAHFAGFRCAKEALRKCDPSFEKAGLPSIVVAHDSGGRPFLEFHTATGVTRLPHALSISHTAAMATAIVIRSGAAPDAVQAPVGAAGTSVAA